MTSGPPTEAGRHTMLFFDFSKEVACMLPDDALHGNIRNPIFPLTLGEDELAWLEAEDIW